MGSVIKSEVKSHFADKSESMGICFLEGKHYVDYLVGRDIVRQAGHIVDGKGNVVGEHNGIICYTIGQRRGVGIPEGYRVVDVDAHNNRIIVGSKEELNKSWIYIEECNIVDTNELLSSSDITVKIRGIGINPQNPVRVESYKDGYLIHFDDPAWAPAKGQPLVLYRNNLVIGGGIVVDFG
jgi:tRNA-specific 2-thiouridylase